MLLTMPHRKQPSSKTAARLGCLLLCLLAACRGAPTPSAQILPARLNPAPTATATATMVIPTATAKDPPASPSPTASLLPSVPWQDLPVIPTQISAHTREIYAKGQEMGQNPHVFARIGDCASAAPDFLVGFDGPYNLGAYTALQPAIDYFHGSFGRASVAAKGGMNSAGLLTTLWTDKPCQSNEDLLDCEYRLNRPSFAFIAIGTNEAYYLHNQPGEFEHNLRTILDDTIAKGIVPILATKADNVEGDESVNATIAQLAQEYQVPLWNFWRAAQPLPEHGLILPEHLSTVSYLNFTDFSLPDSLEYGMQVRNLTALEMLDFLRQNLAEK